MGLLFIVSLERRTQTCVPTSRKTWTFTLDLYDEEWTLSHSGSLLMHHSSYFMQWNYFFILSFPMINNSIPLEIICTNAHYQTGLNKCCFSIECIEITAYGDSDTFFFFWYILALQDTIFHAYLCIYAFTVF